MKEERERDVSSSGGVGRGTCTLKPWIIYTNLKVQKSLLHRFIEMETFVFWVELLYLSGVLTLFNLLRCCVFFGRILLFRFFFVRKLCADRFRSQKRRVIELVFYREIAPSKVEVQTQYTSSHGRWSFHCIFFFNIGPQVGHCAPYVRKCVRFVSLFTACLVWELCDPCPILLCV